KTVGDAYQSIVIDAGSVKKGAKVHVAVDVLVNNPWHRNVYVTDESDVLIGTISYRDLMRVGSARFGVKKEGTFSFVGYMRDMMKENVEDIMKKPTMITRDMKLRDALQLMEDTGQNDLPVVDGDGKIIGELSGMEIMKLGLDIIEKGDSINESYLNQREAMKGKKEADK
ncbi:MAG: CBS domain-containing protein, partial [Candidatus Dadabacteria bacterium]|nr:CBS domain-containing protein [Candidatus Dadabacteria bacterium]